MTDISELVQSLKVAAQEATPGQWFRSSVLFNGITDSANPMEQGNKPHVAYSSEKGDANFIALANPVNILALTAALEQAQARISELEARTVKLPSQVDFDDPLSAYEAIKKCQEVMSAAGIKWESE